MTRIPKRQPSEYTSSIQKVRDVEDCIRATNRYTEGVLTRRRLHPVQGEDFPSKSFWKYYEVYPETEIGWDMPIGVAIDWLWGDVPCIDVMFHYDYRSNRAIVAMKAGQRAIDALKKAIPGFGEAMNAVRANNANLDSVKQA